MDMNSGKQEAKSTAPSIKSRIDIITDAAGEGHDKLALKKELENILVQYYMDEQIFTGMTVHDFYFVTLALHTYVHEDILSIGDISYLSGFLGDHTKIAIQDRINMKIYTGKIKYDGEDRDETLKNIYEIEGGRCLFNAGILSKYHQHTRKPFGEHQITTLGRKCYVRASAKTDSMEESERFARFAENFEYIKSRLQDISENFIFSSHNQYSTKAFNEYMAMMDRTGQVILCASPTQESNLKRLWGLVKDNYSRPA